MERRVRPTLVIGIGEWGAQVAAAFARRVNRCAGRLPVIDAVALVAEGTDVPPEVASIPIPSPGSEPVSSGEHPGSAGLAAALVAGLEQVRRLEAVQATRRAGWEVESGTASGVVLVASLASDEIGRTVLEVARLLHELAGRDFHQVALSAVLWLPRHPGGKETTGPEEDLLIPGKGAQALVAADTLLFDEGCVLIGEANTDGLLVPTGDEQANLVGTWLALQATTSLPAALDRTPPGEAGCHFDTFGLAVWEFPLAALRAHLARRWQREILGQLLAPPDDDQGIAVAFMERHGQPGSPWSQATPLHFRVTGETWATPALDVVHTLRRQIDETAETEWARLDALAAEGQEWLDATCRQAQAALATDIDTLLDGPGLGTTESFLAALEEAARLRTARLEQEAERCCARAAELDERADKAGSALDDLTARFPPIQLRTLLGLALRPWRVLHLWLLYREIGRRSGTYLAYRQSQWLLQAEARERQWQAAFCAGLAQAALEEQEGTAQLRALLERLRGRLAPDRALEQALARRLEAAALPAGLADHFYRQVTGDGAPSPLGLLALYGPLSRWMREGWEAGTLGLILAEHAREQFAFLAEVRMDDLLARTYSGAELRRRLAALVDAATPWWACDEVALNAGERARLCRLVLAGLPDADSSPLVDLLPDRPPACPPSCFSTGDRHQVVVAQVIHGLPLTTLHED